MSTTSSGTWCWICIAGSPRIQCLAPLRTIWSGFRWRVPPAKGCLVRGRRGWLWWLVPWSRSWARPSCPDLARWCGALTQRFKWAPLGTARKLCWHGSSGCAGRHSWHSLPRKLGRILWVTGGKAWRLQRILSTRRLFTNATIVTSDATQYTTSVSNDLQSTNVTLSRVENRVLVVENYGIINTFARTSQ